MVSLEIFDLALLSRFIALGRSFMRMFKHLTVQIAFMPSHSYSLCFTFIFCVCVENDDSTFSHHEISSWKYPFSLSKLRPCEFNQKHFPRKKNRWKKNWPLLQVLGVSVFAEALYSAICIFIEYSVIYYKQITLKRR